MAADLPLKLLLITFAGFVNRDQSRLIAYLLEEDRVFRELQGNKRLRLSDDQRRRNFWTLRGPAFGHCANARSGAGRTFLEVKLRK